MTTEPILSKERCRAPIELHSDNCVLSQIFANVDKFLAGSIDGNELFTYMYVISKARLDVISEELKKKQVDSLT